MLSMSRLVGLRGLAALWCWSRGSPIPAGSTCVHRAAAPGVAPPARACCQAAPSPAPPPAPALSRRLWAVLPLAGQPLRDPPQDLPRGSGAEAGAGHPCALPGPAHSHFPQHPAAGARPALPPPGANLGCALACGECCCVMCAVLCCALLCCAVLCMLRLLQWLLLRMSAGAHPPLPGLCCPSGPPPPHHRPATHSRVACCAC